MLPVVALVGRPNVGKSTLFNALTRRRDALVADLPGVTRDRHYGTCRLGEKPFLAVDTGGLSGHEDGIDALTAQQVQLAIDEAALLVMLVDARDGVTAHDRTIVENLRRRGKPIVLVVNKVDGLDEHGAMADFAELGIADPLPIAASHRHGIDTLLARLDAELPEHDDGDDLPDDDSIRVAIVGRPNAGKSTLVNRLLGEDRVVVSDVAGTTRDAIHVPLERDGHRYTLIDTAGIRRRSKVAEAVEKFSVLKALEAVQAASVVVLLIDARENLAEQDLTLIGFALDAGRALVIALNKWDGLDSDARDACRRALDRRLEFVAWAPRVTLSAKHGSGLRELMLAVRRADAAAGREFGTAELTRAIEAAYAANQPALVRGHAPKLRFAHPGGSHPPTVVIHGSRTAHIQPAYRRYLENFLRKRFRLVGTPIKIEFRDGDNPYAGRKNTLTERQVRKRQRLMRHVRGR